MRGLAGNLSDLTVASSQYDILLCTETLVSDMRHVSGLLVPGFGRHVLLCWGKIPRARGMAAYVRDGYGAFRQPEFECGCYEIMFFMVCGARQNLYVFSLYRNPDIDYQIFDCLLDTTQTLQVTAWLPCRLRISVPRSCLWVIWSSSGVVEFYHHEPSLSCSL